ncbi:hypothetical protein D5086_005387 [Populus alba]|uniref:Uncharacterized protein n=1 Tax=Populus alba TaxID=43335 RepID=A0ACC4CTA2_POPAL
MGGRQKGTSNFSFGIKGIARWDSKLFGEKRSPEGISYFDEGRQKGPHISALNKRESPDGIPSCLKSPEGISYFDEGRRIGPHISGLLRGIARWDSKLFEIAIRDLVFCYLEVARWDLIFHVGHPYNETIIFLWVGHPYNETIIFPWVGHPYNETTIFPGLKEITRWDLGWISILIKLKTKFQINQALTGSVSGVPFRVYLYNTYCAKPMLRLPPACILHAGGGGRKLILPPLGLGMLGQPDAGPALQVWAGIGPDRRSFSGRDRPT